MTKEQRVIASYSITRQLQRLVDRWHFESGGLSRSGVIEKLIFDQAGCHLWQDKDGGFCFDRRPLKVFKAQTGFGNGS